MKTLHNIYINSSFNMDELENESINLVVTSPPYPMISMWDEIFSQMNSEISDSLNNNDGDKAFELMNQELDKTWKELYRVLSPGGFVCINIGDATRKIGDKFQIYMNSARIINKMKNLGFDVLPPIIWKKPTNAPNKFMGSGVLPAGAYVTLENEHILIFRKGNKRIFKTDKEKKSRRQSAFFFEERNQWFTNIWNIAGVKQNTKNGENRKRNAAFGHELPYRLISMYSVQGDTVLDPFTGTGTTNLAAALLGRNSIGYEIDETILKEYDNKIHNLISRSQIQNSERLNRHVQYLKDYKKQPKYFNQNIGLSVVTSQEKEIKLRYISKITKISKYNYEIEHPHYSRRICKTDHMGLTRRREKYPDLSQKKVHTKEKNNMNRPCMKCGHTAQATKNGKPICAICYPSTDAITIIEKPDLTERIAKCIMCERRMKSNTNLPFFHHCKDSEYDRYYCGCRGWS